MQALQAMQALLKDWCDATIAPGQAYGSQAKAFTGPAPKGGKLVYQDGTACSASHAFSDVYLLPDATYIVQTDVGQVVQQGGEEIPEFVEKKCETIVDVLDHLLCFCGHDPNTVGDLLCALYFKLGLTPKRYHCSWPTGTTMRSLLKRCEADAHFCNAFCDALRSVDDLAYNNNIQ